MFAAGVGSTLINVRSVWFLLLYASDLLDILTAAEKEKLAGGDRDNDLLDALADVLAAQVEVRLRSMLARGYQSSSEPLARVRGRIDHLGTERRRLMESGKIQCCYMEQTVNLPRYRFMLVTLRRAARGAVSESVSRRCLTTAQLLERSGVSSMDPTPSEISKEHYGHFDQPDRKLMAVSTLVREMCAPEHSSGTDELPAILRNEHALRGLFEKAIRGFYRHHLVPTGYMVSAKSTAWPAAGENTALAFLPRLNADVLIRGPGHQTVVECKFAPIFVERHGKVMLDPGYLRQLYSYASVFSHGFNGRTCALLLGALVDRSSGRNLDFVLDGIPFTVRQIDLSSRPREIREALLAAFSAGLPEASHRQ
ncbi:5-methylcytosine restriction system specificity protein McrC [Dietzia natronolimnaea]|uniref:5-methylcytosine restriction system specificity protein McrC n=1 Tax=Dietzia natronolimnaea TaxID=161920 RepID=UPI003D0C67FA